MKKTNISLVLVLLLSLLAFTGAALADDSHETTGRHVETTPISGTVVDVDLEEDTIEILLADGTTEIVKVDETDYDHPIVRLLDEYFGLASLADLDAALDTLAADGTDADALDLVEVDINVVVVDDTNTLVDVGDEIEAYHSIDGIGFGDLVKIYTIEEEWNAACELIPETDPLFDPDCAVTVEDLVALFVDDGLSMGTLFDDFLKPSLLGVGHVRQALAFGGGTGGGGGTTLCHIPSGDPDKAHFITVGADAVDSHLAHGDTLGAGC